MRTAPAWPSVFLVGACASFTAAPAADDAGAPADAAADVVLPPAKDPSCKALLASTPALHGRDGTYVLATPGGPRRAACDMTTDGGGWTLVGRSGAVVSDPPPPFGWSSATGDLEKPNLPYAFDAAGAQLTFDELLVTTLDRTQVYRVAVGPDFLAARRKPVPNAEAVAIAGACRSSPTMLRFAGASAYTDTFFFRDIEDASEHRGLKAGGFDLTYDECAKGGLLDKKPGALYVR